MNENNKPKAILVTGSHRSGSTWAGRILAAAPHTAYIHEPFNFNILPRFCTWPFKNWFQYINDQNAADYEMYLQDIYRFHYPLLSNLSRARTPRHLARIVRDQSLWLLHAIKRDIPIIKDPIALFSTPWLVERFRMNVLVLIRHPAAFCSSLKIKGWKFKFSHFLNQTLLMKDYLAPFKKDIQEYAENEKSLLDQAILLWNCIHFTIAKYKTEHPEWLFIRHEDLSLQPEEEFRNIYEKFGLTFTPKVRATILEMSGTHNPAEQGYDSLFRRDSKANIHNWKKRLSQAEIAQIKERTREIAGQFYAIEEW